MDIRKLINNNKWDTVFNLIYNNNLDVYTDISRGNTVAHLAAINNNFKIINYFIKHDINLLMKSNNEGNTPLHLLAIYGYLNLLKKCLQKNIEFIYLLNNNNQNILNILYNDFNFINWITKFKIINFNNKDNTEESILIKNIKETTNINDKNYEIIKKILKYKPEEDNALFIAINENKNYIVTLLIENNFDINKYDSEYLTPLLQAIKNKNQEIIDFLINNGANINYMGPEGDSNPMILSMTNNDEKTINMLLEKDFDVNKYNRYVETPLHFCLRFNLNLSPTIIAKLIYKTDLNLQNIKGETPLHLLCKFNIWKNYNKILSQKDLDIFVKDKYNNRPIDYLNVNTVYNFIDIVLNSYTKLFNNQNENENQLSPIKNCNNIKSKECTYAIKKYIFDTKRSIPIKNDYSLMYNKLNMIDNNPVDFGMFNSDSLHNMIYTVILMKKYKSIGIPFQYYINDKFINDKFLLTNNDLFMTSYEKVISDIVKIYSDFFYEITPYLILWRSESQYFIHKDLKFYIKKCLFAEEIRFIVFKLTLVIGTNSTHANIIIYDKEKNTLERFEPYGIIPYIESNKLDNFIKKKLGKILKKKVKYYTPEELFKSIGFQIISGDNQNILKKLGDPFGYCLAWTFWYLEMRITNSNISPPDLLIICMKNIINKNSMLSEKSFLNFIRDYASNMDKIKNEFLITAGISPNDIYNLVPTVQDQYVITNALSKEFKIIVSERYNFKLSV